MNIEKLGELLTVEQFANEIGLSPGKIEGLIEWGELIPHKKTNTLPRSEISRFLKLRAYHEAGHVLQARIVRWNTLSASIVPNQKSFGRAELTPPSDEYPEWRPDDTSIEKEFYRRHGVCFEKCALIMSAGREAEFIKFGKYPNDQALEGDCDCLKDYIVYVLENNQSDHLKIIKSKSDEVRKTLQDNMSTLDELASLLLKKRELTEKDLDSFFNSIVLELS